MQKLLAHAGCVARLKLADTTDLGGLNIRYGPNLREGPSDVESTVIGPNGTLVG